MFFFKKKPAQTITVLPHPRICPSGEVVAALPGRPVVESLLKGGVDISHSCQMQCSCTTCHIYLMEGTESVTPMDAEENRVLDGAPDRARWSRLACQTVVAGKGDLVVEIRN